MSRPWKDIDHRRQIVAGKFYDGYSPQRIAKTSCCSVDQVYEDLRFLRREGRLGANRPEIAARLEAVLCKPRDEEMEKTARAIARDLGEPMPKWLAAVKRWTAMRPTGSVSMAFEPEAE